MVVPRREALVVTRSAAKAAAVTASNVNPDTPPTTPKRGSQKRSYSIVTATDPDISNEDSPTKSLAKSPSKSPSKSPKKRILYEDFVDHVEILPSGELPSSFVSYHNPLFIEGVKHILQVDPTLYRSIVAQNFERYKREQGGSVKEEVIPDSKEVIIQYWLNLISSVMSQQISGKAAAAIYQRFENLFEVKPNPQELLTKLTEELRAIGLSGQKVKYVYHISEVFNNPQEPLTKVEFYKENELPAIVEELVKLKGIGEWSAKMFALFTLKEWDVFAHDDLGIARGAYFYLNRRPEMLKLVKQQVHQDENMKALLKKKGKFENSKGKRDWTPLHDQYLLQLSKRFSPYRSIFMVILWRLSATTIDILEDTGQ